MSITAQRSLDFPGSAQWQSLCPQPQFPPPAEEPAFAQWVLQYIWLPRFTAFRSSTLQLHP
jgi:hypothetical protein